MGQGGRKKEKTGKENGEGKLSAGSCAREEWKPGSCHM